MASAVRPPRATVENMVIILSDNMHKREFEWATHHRAQLEKDRGHAL